VRWNNRPARRPHSRNLRCNKVLHRRVVVLTVATAQIPHVPDEEWRIFSRVEYVSLTVHPIRWR